MSLQPTKSTMSKLLQMLLEQYKSECEDESPLHLQDVDMGILKQHKQAKKDLEEKRAVLLRQLLETGRDIIKCRHEYGQLYNSRSPVNKLPDELLALIFCALVGPGKINGTVTNPLPEVAISHVCTRWRHLALSVPSLWNFFHFDGDVEGRVPQGRLNAYIKRSRDKPLNLWFNLATDHDERERQKGLANTFYKEGHRVGICRMQTDDEGLVYDQSYNHDEAPMLQALSMVHQDQSVPWEASVAITEWSPCIFKAGAPSLKYVHLDDCSINYFRPPLDHVVHLRLEGAIHARPSTRFSSAVFDYILSLTHLTSLSIRGNLFDTSTSSQSRALVEAPSLRHFRCDQTEDDLPLSEYFLSNTFAPALQSITLEDLESIDNTDRFKPTPNRFPALHTLAIRDPALSFAELLPLFAATPSVSHLIWSEPHCDCWEAMYALAQKDVGLLPDVEQVTIDALITQEHHIRRKLVSAFPKLLTLKVHEKVAAALKDPDGGDEGRPIKITTIQPTVFPSEQDWISEPAWIEVGDGAFSGWEYFDCLSLD